MSTGTTNVSARAYAGYMADFKTTYSTSVLTSICDRLGLPASDTALKGLHNYLKSRVQLLTSVPVSLYFALSPFYV